MNRLAVRTIVQMVEMLLLSFVIDLLVKAFYRALSGRRRNPFRPRVESQRLHAALPSSIGRAHLTE